MLLLREDRFVKKDGKLFIVGSGSNSLYRNNAYTIGKIDILAWYEPAEKYDVSKLEEYVPNPNINLILNDNRLSLFEKYKIIKKEVKKCDAVIAKLSLLQAMIGCHFAIKYKKPLIIESAADAFAALWYHGGGIKYRIAAFPLNWLIKKYHRKARYVIYCSQHYLQTKYPCKGKSYGCADSVMPVPDKNVLNARLEKINSQDKKDKYVVGLIGVTQAEYRGHDVLIAAVGVLRKKGYRNIEIKFLGGGRADQQRIRCAKKWQVEDSVTFCGRLPHDKVLNWLDEIDALVMPTQAEALGRAVIEAMSRGCPVIGSVETALSELLGADCLIHAKNYEEIADRVERLITDKDFSLYTAIENFYRSYKYSSEYINGVRQKIYNQIKSDI